MSSADHTAHAAPAGVHDGPGTSAVSAPGHDEAPATAGTSGLPPPWPSALSTLRDRGAEQAEPVRWRFLEALARRAAATQGRTRTVLDARLATLVAEFAARLDARAATAASAWPTARAAAERREPGPLAGLAAALAGEPPAPPEPEADARLADRRASPAPAQVAQPAPAGATRGPRPAASRTAPPVAELKASRLFGRGWARLAADAQLQRARATLPAQTGPLNSERLVLAALQRLQVIAPDHLARLLAEVEALRWLARAEAADPAPAAGTGTTGAQAARRAPPIPRPRSRARGR